MRLSTVVELLLILLLVAFAAYGRVIERDEVNHRSIRAVDSPKQPELGLSTMSLKQATDSVNRFCTCNENICNCCRDFHIPLVQMKGPGCASLQYLQGDNLAVQLSFGDNILTSTIVSGKSPKPVCVPLPGGFTKFCGRIYSIQRDAKDHFKACLGLELQSSTELEASLRVSCFRFGPDGLKLRPAEPLPVVEAEASEEEDDDDFFGLGGDDDDDEDDEEEENTPLANSVPNSSAADDTEEEDDEDDDEDVLGFGALLDIITGDDESSTKKPKVTTAAPLLQFTIPILTRPTSSSPLDSVESADSGNNVPLGESETSENDEITDDPEKLEGENNTDFLTSQNEDGDSTDSSSVENNEEQVADASNKIAHVTKPAKISSNKVKVTESNKKKVSITSSSINAIEDGNKKKKPAAKPIKDEDDDDDDILGDDDDDDDDDDLDEDDDDDILEDEDEKDEEDDEENEELDEDEKNEDHDEDEDEKAEDVDDLDDDDDEEEDAMISALVYDDKDKGKKQKATKIHENDAEDDEEDYGLGLTGLLARKRHSRSGRQSRIMRL